MKIDGRHINTGIRRDGGPKPFDPAKIVVDTKRDTDGNIFIRIDDQSNPEFWIALEIKESEIKT